MTELLLALALTAPAAPPAEDKGWELKIDAPALAEPMFVGQYLDVTVTVTLKNVTDKERGYVPQPRLVDRRVLDADILQPDEQLMRRIGEPPVRDDFKNLTPLAAGKAVSFRVKLSRFGFTNVRKPGKHVLRMSYTTPEGRASSNTITFTVHDPAKADVLARHAVALAGRDAQAPADERVSAFVDQVQVEEKTYLLYRRFVGPKYGGGCDFAARLAELPGKVDMVVAGAFGDVLGNHKPLVIAYAHKPNGMTTLRVESIGGEIEERLVHEPAGKGDDPKRGWGLFEQCKFDNRDDMPPEKLRRTYGAFVESVKTGGQAKFCLRSVEVIDREVPDRPNSAQGINIPWMKTHFSPDVVICEKQPDGTFYLRTNTSLLYWVETRSGEWKLFVCGDKPIK